MRLFPLCLLLGCLFHNTARAQTTAQQQVTIVVEEVRTLSVSAENVTVTLDAVSAGSSDFEDEVDGSTSYSLHTNGTGLKITGVLDEEYAAGIRLKVQLAEPAGASAKKQTLSTMPQDLVTGIGSVQASNLPITYTVSANYDALPNTDSGGETRTVTFTITE